MAAAEQEPEPLKYQILTLKVSIHCEGCKKKVKKVLQNIEDFSGVYKTIIDSQQQKVVVTGNVDAETLIKKLLRTGKHAELWPETKPNENTSGGGSKKNKKNKNKNNSKPSEASEGPENNQTSSIDDSSTDASDKPESEVPKNGGTQQEKQEGGEKAAATASSGGCGGGKKKGKKGQKEDNKNINSHTGGGGGGGVGVGGGAEIAVVPQEAIKKIAGGAGGVMTPLAINFPVHTSSHLPSSVLSYSSVQPSMSYGGAYYMVSPLHESSYVYSKSTPSSYYMFSDENANACSIM